MAAAPPRPPAPMEARLVRVLMRLTWARGLHGAPQDPAPPAWRATSARIPRASGGSLDALVFDHPTPRGVVLLAHPGIAPAKGYFHRGDRIPFLRDLGFAVATFDLGGFGGSDAPRATYADEWLDVLSWARGRFPGAPLHVWGVSIGGYFAHHALAESRAPPVASAVFEQVSPDLFRYGRRPGDRLGLVERALRTLAPAAAAWMPAIAHAPFLRVPRVLHLTGTADHGIAPAQSRALVAASPKGARHVEVDGAPHLGAWKGGGEAVRRAVRDAMLGLKP